MRGKACAYCGRTSVKLTADHVIPRNLYPSSKASSKVQRLTVPCCGECNNGWSDDEAHFRNVLLLAGNPNDSVHELWSTVAQRSFNQPDGRRRLEDIFSQLVPTVVDGKARHLIYPGKDERVLRVVCKIVRGLSYYHSVLFPVNDNQVIADILRHAVPEEFLEMMRYEHREKDVCEYKYAVLREVGIDSVWMLTFFQRTTFIAAVIDGDENLIRPELS